MWIDFAWICRAASRVLLSTVPTKADIRSKISSGMTGPMGIWKQQDQETDLVSKLVLHAFQGSLDIPWTCELCFSEFFRRDVVNGLRCTEGSSFRVNSPYRT